MTSVITDLRETDVEVIDEIAQILYECFQKHAPNYLPDIQSCKEEILESFDAGRRSRVLKSELGSVLGWIGAFEDEHVWEIHPIAVSPKAQRRGYGLKLVHDIEELARGAGAAAVWAGTSDETNATSFSRIDLYRDASAALHSFEADSDHPVNFWLKAGYSLVGVMPDEEGIGMPGIHFAKRIVANGT